MLSWASALSTAGNTFLLVAAPLTLLKYTGSPLLATLTIGVQAVSYVASPLLGPLLDSCDRRLLFVAGELLQGVAIGAIPPLIAHHQVGIVFGSLALSGLASIVSSVALDYGIIPRLVPRARLTFATSRFNSMMLVAQFLGPGLAGLLVAVAGTSWTLEMDAATFLITVLAAFVIPGIERGNRPVSHLRMLREGFSYFWSRRDLRRLTLVLAFYNLGAGALQPAILAVGKDSWHWNPSLLGFIISCGALAAAVGSWLSPHFVVHAGLRRRLFAWLSISVVASLGLLAHYPILITLSFSLLCFAEGGVNSVTMSYRQLEIASDMAGRVNTVIRTFVTGAISASALLLGFSISFHSFGLAFAPAPIFAITATVLWLAGRRSSIAGLRGLVIRRLTSYAGCNEVNIVEKMAGLS